MSSHALARIHALVTITCFTNTRACVHTLSQQTHAHSHIQENKHTHEHALAQMHTHIEREMTKRGELFFVKKDGLNAS